MKSVVNMSALVLTFSMAVSSLAKAEVSDNNRWMISAPILRPGPPGSFDEVSVKDPSIVHFEGLWHLFYTARSKTEYTTGYVSAKKLTDLQSARRHELTMIRGKTRYGCAPQVLYYEPQQKWYMIFQNRDANYQPMFSTTPTISNADTWSDPLPLLTKDTGKKWIDFWVICDKTNAYLFYTEGHRGVVVRSTSLEDFPKGWSDGKKAFDNVHEAVHVYKVRGRSEYHMIYEFNRSGIRSFGLASASHIEGPWKKVTDRYATGEQLRYSDKIDAWTEMVSHGEALRSGYNQQLEYEPKGCQWLIQGIMKKDSKGPYPSLRWRLGIMSKVASSGEQGAAGDTDELRR
jgi:hypothetical protein